MGVINMSIFSEQEKLIEILKERSEKNMKFHEGIVWGKVKEKLERMPEKLWAINEMELTYKKFKLI